MEEAIVQKRNKASRSNKKLSTLKYRGFIMGIATLAILFYHCPIKMDNSLVLTIKSIGYSGVDLFVFCSGWGCSLSYLKNKSAYKFWGRRAKRILPVWFILLIAFWAPTYIFINKKISFPVVMTVIGNVLGLQAFTEKGGVFCWYISLLIVTYLLAPLLVQFCNKHELPGSCLVILLLILLSFPFWQTTVLILIFSRLPLFYIGIVFQKYWSRIRSGNTVLGIGIAMIIGYVTLFITVVKVPTDVRWNYGLFWYPCILIAPGMSLSLNWLAKKMDSSPLSPVVRFISWIGKISFEVYLIQELIKVLVNYLIQTGHIKGGNLIWILLFIASIFLAQLLNWAGMLFGRMFED